MPDQTDEDRGTSEALVLVVVLLAIIASGLIVLNYERARQYPSGGREALTLAFSTGELKQLEQRRLVTERSGALRPSPPNR